MIDQGTIDRIMAAADIVGVVGEYVSLRKRGANYVGLCPFHDDTHPSFSVSPSRGVCKCFSCGKGGNVVHFVMEIEQISYYDALRKLARKYNIDIKEREQSDEERRSQNERESMYALNEWACQHFHQLMLTHEDGRAIGLAYFRSRGFRDDMIERFRLGYCLDQWDAFSAEARRKGFKPEFLTATGLSTQRENGTLIDKFRGRAIFPWLNVSGKVVGFGGRVLDQRTKGVAQKYVNSPDSPVFHKSQELYGIFQAKRQIAKEDHVFMVEGYTDVIAMHQCGVENVVANSGTALNISQIKLLRRFTQHITLIYDGDEAGIHAALRGTDMLLAEGMDVKVLLLPEGHDPDSFARQHSATELRAYVDAHATDFILFKTSLIKPADTADPRKRSELASGILQSICVIPDEIVRSTYVHQCAAQLHMDEAMLLRSCNKLRRTFLDKRRQERDNERARQERLQREGNGNGAATPPGAGTETPASPQPPAGSPSSPTPPASQAGSTTPPPSPAPPATPTRPFDRNAELERLIMREVVRYGHLPILTLDAEGATVETAIADYVSDNLAMDAMRLQTPVLARMLELWSQCPDKPAFAHFLLTLPDADISREASALLTDRHQLSRRFADEPTDEQTAPARIAHLIYDYKFLYIERLIAEQRRLLAASTDDEAVSAALERIQQLTHAKRLLGERIGEKIM